MTHEQAAAFGMSRSAIEQPQRGRNAASLLSEAGMAGFGNRAVLALVLELLELLENCRSKRLNFMRGHERHPRREADTLI